MRRSIWCFSSEVGDAVAQQAADAVALFEQRHGMAGARQLLRAGQAGRARAHHRDLLAGLARRHLRRDPALGPALVDDGVLDGLDADRVAVDVQGTGGFARRRADAAGELRKLLVECSTSSARRQSCRYTRSFQSGMMLLTGQPLLQNGMPQSMQRAACCLAWSSFRCSTNSRQFFSRFCGASEASCRRWYSMNPVIFPMISLTQPVVAGWLRHISPNARR